LVTEGIAEYFGLRGKFRRFERLSVASSLALVAGATNESGVFRWFTQGFVF
jgi:hypothetical protein